MVPKKATLKTAIAIIAAIIIAIAVLVLIISWTGQAKNYITSIVENIK